MLEVLIGAFLVKSLVAILVWSGRLTEVSYQAVLHVRRLEGKPFTSGEDALEKQALKSSSIFALGLPVLGCLAVTMWPNAALPLKGRFEGAENFRRQVREICWRAFIPDVAIAVGGFVYWTFI